MQLFVIVIIINVDFLVKAQCKQDSREQTFEFLVKIG